MYHCPHSLVNLSWIISSIVMDSRLLLLVSTVAYCPILTWEFVMIYGMRIPIVADKPFFKEMGRYFDFEMKNPPLEMTFMFVTLGLFFMMWASFKIETSKVDSNFLLHYLSKRILGNRREGTEGSALWRFSFMYIIPYIQIAFTLYLFFRGISNINNFFTVSVLVMFYSNILPNTHSFAKIA